VQHSGAGIWTAVNAAAGEVPDPAVAENPKNPPVIAGNEFSSFLSHFLIERIMGSMRKEEGHLSGSDLFCKPVNFIEPDLGPDVAGDSQVCCYHGFFIRDPGFFQFFAGTAILAPDNRPDGFIC